MGTGVYRRPWRYFPSGRRIAPGPVGIAPIIPKPYRPFLHHLVTEPGVFRRPWDYFPVARKPLQPISITGPPLVPIIARPQTWFPPPRPHAYEQHTRVARKKPVTITGPPLIPILFHPIRRIEYALATDPGVYRKRWNYERMTVYRRTMPITITGPAAGADREGLVPLLTVRPLGALNVG